MSSPILYFKKRPHFLILGLILLIGLFFRSYKIIERFEFAHDGDLYSWIVKDIVVNHHFRLIGQLTSAPGIFIGGLFYYLLIPFFLLSNMDSVGVSLLGIIVGIFTILSYYFVLSKLFNKAAGISVAFLHSVLITTVGFDQWIVPTLPTKLWAIWYFYTVISVSRGNFAVLPFLGILVGLIWHVHLALVPLLLVIPVSLIAARKLPNIRIIFYTISAFLITSLPFIIFEFRHHFSQTLSLFQNFIIPQSGESGLPKLLKVLEMIAKNTTSLLLLPQSLPQILILPFLILFIILTIFLLKKKILKFKESLIIYTWLFAVIIFFSITRTPISEYYFANLEIIFLTIIGLFSSTLMRSKLGLYLTVFLCGVIFIKNLIFEVTWEPYRIGYLDRKAVVKYITEDIKTKGFPCIGITYITKPGENVGFRYLFYLKDTHLVHPSLDIPVYNIVIPEELSREVKQKFGHIGLIPPTSIPSKEIIDKSCQTPNTNLTDSMFGYVE